MLSGNKIFILPLYWLFILISVILAIQKFDSLPDRLMSSDMSRIALSFFPLIAEIAVSIIALLLVYQMWAGRKYLKARYGQLSYQHIFFVGFAGISCIMALSINQFIRPWAFAPCFWLYSPLHFLTVTPEAYWNSFFAAILWMRMLLAVFFTILGILMAVRSVQTFGFDYMTVIYLYFPEESKFKNHEIYSVLRHPAYTGVILVGLGGTFFTATLYSFIFFIIIVLNFYIHIHFVEEKELIERFGQAYREHIKKVPAFFVMPNNIPVLFRFLLAPRAAR